MRHTVETPDSARRVGCGPNRASCAGRIRQGITNQTRTNRMELDTLKALYIEELKDLYSAENQILKALPRMTRAASHKELKKAFTTHERQTREQVKRLERICKELGVS